MTTWHAPSGDSTLMFAGHGLSAGGWVSITVTVKSHVAVLLEASVALQLTIVAPRLNVEPLAGVQLNVTPGQLSVARPEG